MSNKLQNEEFILQGDLGTVNGREIKKVEKRKDGSTTLTISGKEYARLNNITHTEDADFEIVQPKQLKNPE